MRFGGQWKSIHFNANPLISIDVNDVLWKSKIINENCISMHFKKEQRFSLEIHELFMNLNEFQYKSTCFHENQLFLCISMTFHEGHKFQLNHEFLYVSKRFYLFTIALKYVIFHWVPWVTLTFIDAHWNALVYFDVHWNSMYSISIHWFLLRKNIGEWCFSAFGHVWWFLPYLW